MRKKRPQISDPQALRRLLGARVLLRVPEIADVKAIFAYASNAESSRFLAWTPHQSESETESFLSDGINAWEGDERRPWVVEAGGRVVGMIEAKLKGRNAGIGYVLAPELWGQGYATEALCLVSDALFHYSAVSAIWALCVTENPASARVLEKCGYQREKRIPGYFHCPNLGGEKYDVWRYVRYQEAN